MSFMVSPLSVRLCRSKLLFISIALVIHAFTEFVTVLEPANLTFHCFRNTFRIELSSKNFITCLGGHDNCKARNLPNSSGACLLAAMSQHCSAHRVICFRENLCGLRSILSLNFSCKTGSEARLELGLKRSY